MSIPRRIFRNLPNILPREWSWDNYSIEFDGVNGSYIALPPIRDHTITAITHLTWVRKNTAGGLDWLADFRDAANRGAYLAIDGNRIRIRVSDNLGVAANFTSAIVVPPAGWHLVGGAYEDPDLAVYLDGERMAALNVGSFNLWVGGGGETILGAQATTHDRVLDGLMANAMTFDRVLTLDEHRRVLRSGIAKSLNGCVARYKLEEGGGTIITDTSGLGHNGNMIGGVSWRNNQLYELLTEARV